MLCPQVQWALNAGKRLVAVVHAGYVGQSPLRCLPRDVVEGTAGEVPWSEEEVHAVAAAEVVCMFKGAGAWRGDGGLVRGGVVRGSRVCAWRPWVSVRLEGWGGLMLHPLRAWLADRRQQ